MCRIMIMKTPCVRNKTLFPRTFINCYVTKKKKKKRSSTMPWRDTLTRFFFHQKIVHKEVKRSFRDDINAYLLSRSFNSVFIFVFTWWTTQHLSRHFPLLFVLFHIVYLFFHFLGVREVKQSGNPIFSVVNWSSRTLYTILQSVYTFTFF